MVRAIVVCWKFQSKKLAGVQARGFKLNPESCEQW